MPGHANSLNHPCFFRTHKCMECTIRLLDQPDIALCPHIVDLPEAEMVTTHAAERAGEIFKSPGGIPLCRFARLECHVPPGRVLRPVASVVLFATGVHGCGVIVPDPALVR